MSEDGVTAFATALLKEHGLFQQGWRFVWEDARGPLAGMCRSEDKVIVGFRKLLLDTAVENVRETVLHEIAHALTMDHSRMVRQWHHQMWYDKLIEIGGKGVWVSSDGSAHHVKIDPTYLTTLE